jgi:RNA polymerase sigma-70 factor (ECF subfamily)
MLKGKSTSESLAYLFNNFATQMYAVANGILKDSHLAEDVVQDALIRLSKETIMKNLKNMENNALKVYVLMTTKNVALNFYRKRKREGSVTIGEYNEDELNRISVEDSAEAVVQKMEEKELYDIVKGLPEKYSEVLILKYKYELKNKQIATACDITEVTVRKRLERGKKLLLERLEKRHYFEEYSLRYRKGST